MKLKRLPYSLVLVGFLSLLNFSCKKDDKTDSSTTTQTTSADFFTAKVDGVDYKATYITDVTTNDTTFQITSSCGKERMLITFLKGSKAGTYVIAGNFNSKGGMYNNGDNNHYSAKSGSITLTTAGPAKFEGTFNFVAKEFMDETKVKTITEGKFCYTM